MHVALASRQKYHCPTIKNHANRHCHVGRRLAPTRRRDRRCVFPPGFQNLHVALARRQRWKDVRCTSPPSKIKKLRVALVSPSSLLPGFNIFLPFQKKGWKIDHHVSNLRTRGFLCLVMTGPQIQTVLNFTYFPKSIIRVHIIVIKNRGPVPPLLVLCLVFSNKKIVTKRR